MRTQGRAVYVCFWYHRHLLLRATVRALPIALLLSRQAPCSSTSDPFRKDQEPQGPRPNSQRRPQPPLLGAARTLDHNSPAAAGGASSLRAATATSHSPRRSICVPDADTRSTLTASAAATAADGRSSPTPFPTAC